VSIISFDIPVENSETKKEIIRIKMDENGGVVGIKD